MSISIGKYTYMTQEEAEKRYERLYDKAVRRYLDKTDFDISEWLSKEEYSEFKTLQDN